MTQALLQMTAIQAVTPNLTGWRCLHASEGGFVNPAGMPNVRRAKNAPPVEITPALEQLLWDVMRAKNPTITRGQFDNIFAGGTAFCNGHDINGNDPKLMDGLICAGMFLPDTVGFAVDSEGEYLVAIPGVHAVDATKPLPTAQQVIDNRWYFVANTGQGSTGAFNFPQGNGGEVCVAYVLREPARYRKQWFERWAADRYPDPLRYRG